MNRVEESAIGSFLELVTKLNEASFKPLFTRLYDWAVIDLSEGKGEPILTRGFYQRDEADHSAINDQRLTERKTVLLHVMSGLLNKFRVSFEMFKQGQQAYTAAPSLTIHWYSLTTP